MKINTSKSNTPIITQFPYPVYKNNSKAPILSPPTPNLPPLARN